MTEVHTMREIENLEACNASLDKALNEEYRRNKKLSESLKACKLDVNKLRAAVEEIYKSSDQVHIIEIARAVL